MITQAQGILSKFMGVFSSSGSSVKALMGSHPVALGIVVGIGAYYAVNKYWLNPEGDEEVAIEEGSEDTDGAEIEKTVEETATA